MKGCRLDSRIALLYLSYLLFPFPFCLGLELRNYLYISAHNSTCFPFSSEVLDLIDY